MYPLPAQRVTVLLGSTCKKNVLRRVCGADVWFALFDIAEALFAPALQMFKSNTIAGMKDTATNKYASLDTITSLQNILIIAIDVSGNLYNKKCFVNKNIQKKLICFKNLWNIGMILDVNICNVYLYSS
jgi:hypothetical protein